MSDLHIHPLTPDRIDDFLMLFGPSGACYGCWCQHFRIRPRDRQTLSSEAKRELMIARINQGPPPGLIAFQGDDPVGWMQIGPRADVPEWNNPGRSSSPLPDAPADDPAVWAVSCFYFRSRVRGRGLSHQMLAAGINHARTSGARLLEASPMDQAKQSKSIGLFVGSTSTFAKAGFQTVAQAKPNRPLMRLAL